MSKLKNPRALKRTIAINKYRGSLFERKRQASRGEMYGDPDKRCDTPEIRFAALAREATDGSIKGGSQESRAVK